jgi:teichuronic acid biosynthesis glycosyltransferase TuaH
MKILYIMNVDWNWIPQRPHFIAHNLAQNSDILVLFPYSRNRKNLVKNNHGNLKILPIILIPYWKKYKLLMLINNFIGFILYFIIKIIYKPDIIWISSPELGNLIPSNNDKPVFYDCMDDILEFDNNQPSRKLLKALEQKIIDKSKAIFFSSQNLRESINQRYNVNCKTYLIHNAFQPNEKWRRFEKKTTGTIKIGYIGTISSWIDWSSLMVVLNSFENIEISLIGPTESNLSKTNIHSRLIILPPIEHDQLSQSAATFDMLIIPFKINELIKSVDPVKLYEYIYFDKPIISIKYQDLLRFEPFVHFYENHIDLCELIHRLIKSGIPKKYTDLMRSDFINSNKWSNRVTQINEIIKENIN